MTLNMNRKELRKIGNTFNSNANRLMQANFEDYTSVVRIFVAYIKDTPLIYDYITSCGECDWDLDSMFKEIRCSYGRKIFPIGESVDEEVREVFAILNYIAEHNESVYDGIAMGYASSKKYQDFIKGFNDRVVMILIRHIETYINNIGIDMGLDEKITYNITVSQGGQVNVASDNAVINAPYTVGLDSDQLIALISSIRNSSDGLSDDDRDVMDTSLQTIQEEATSAKPKKKYIKMGIRALNAIKGSAEFLAAVVALSQFLQSAGLLLLK